MDGDIAQCEGLGNPPYCQKKRNGYIEMYKIYHLLLWVLRENKAICIYPISIEEFVLCQSQIAFWKQRTKLGFSECLALLT